ncbi:MAG TPA: phage portal protein [Terracidiphilus sp.]|nr:phage portal protein [Terracidiphilus sp.]
MSILTIFGNNPELIRGSMADVVDAAGARADGYESSSPTGLPPMSDVEAWEDILIGLKTETGITVTPERAKRCATVLAIMRGLEEDVSSLDCPLMKRGEKEDVRAVDHPVDRIVNVAPNAIMTPMEVRGHMMFDLMTWGNFYNLINYTGSTAYSTGEIDSVWPLQAAYVVRRWRQMLWTFTDPTTGISGEFTPDTVWRGTILSGNGIDGTAITLLCREAIGLLLAAEEQGARLFSQGIQTDFVLETPNEEPSETERKDIRDALMRRHGGYRNSWKPMILSGGMVAKKLGLTAQESQYLEARGFQVAEIARAFRYPEVLLGTAGKGSKTSTYASAEQFFDSYTKHTLKPWTTRKEQCGNRDLLTTKEKSKYYLRHDFSSLLRANETARIANWNAKIMGGWAQPAEARYAEGMSYKPGLEYFSKPAGSTGVADGQPDKTPTDQSALARRVALHLFNREEKALVANKQDADAFYTNFGGYIESLTGADGLRIRSYLEGRRNTVVGDRFSPEAVVSAVTFLTSLAKDNQNQ